MPVNHYFQGGQGIGNQFEKTLYEDLISESLKIYGHDVYYLPRTLVNRDLILGEDTSSRFDDTYMIEAYFETTEGFAGQKELINKFGLEIREDTTFVISKRSWQQQVDNPMTQIVEGRPNEGDLIYFPLMNSFFEIQFVEDQEPLFQLGSLPVYKLRVTRFEYSNEQFNTGIREIDDAEVENTLDTLLYKFTLENETGSFILEDYHNDETGASVFFLNENYEAAVIQTQNKFAQNKDMDDEAGFNTGAVTDDILDFTERNPFGELDD